MSRPAPLSLRNLEWSCKFSQKKVSWLLTQSCESGAGRIISLLRLVDEVKDIDSRESIHDLKSTEYFAPRGNVW